jgi:hypothetical protein
MPFVYLLTAIGAAVAVAVGVKKAKGEVRRVRRARAANALRVEAERIERGG